MYSLPSASQIRAPSPFAATTGSPPTPRNARTGEFTPPGNNELDRRRISADRSAAIAAHGGKRQRPSHCQGRYHRRGYDPSNDRCPEIVIVDNFLRRDVGEFSRHKRLVDECHSVDVVGLPRKSSDSMSILVDAIDNQPMHLAKP